MAYQGITYLVKFDSWKLSSNSIEYDINQFYYFIMLFVILELISIGSQLSLFFCVLKKKKIILIKKKNNKKIKR